MTTLVLQWDILVSSGDGAVRSQAYETEAEALAAKFQLERAGFCVSEPAPRTV